MQTQNTEKAPGRFASWLAYVRPKTWGVAVAPVLASLSLYVSEHHSFQWDVAFFTLTIAVLMQIITNMQNDRGYTQRKLEKGNRRGLPRATVNGWISMKAARYALLGAVFLALLNTAVLVWYGGIVFLAVGVASVLAAYAYMGGPKPIAYTPFGELVVLIFFGLTAVCGTYYLQAGVLSFNSVLLGVALGSVAAAVLAVNNWRDHVHDASVGRRTLAVVCPPKLFVMLYEAMLLLPYFLVLVMVLRDLSYWPYLLVIFTLADALHLPPQLTKKRHEELNGTMFATVLLEVKFALFFTTGALIQAFLSSTSHGFGL